MCPNCRAFITTSDRTCPYCEVQVGEKAIDRRAPADLLGGLIPHAHFTTVLILLINVGLYVAMALHGTRTGGSAGWTDFPGRTLFDFGAKFGPALREGEWWRLITAGFLHGGLLHIAMNSWVLFDLGARTEENYGTARFLVFYIASTITGFYGSYLWSPGSLSVGSSAGIFGLIGAMIALGVRDGSAYGSEVRRMYTQWAIYGLVMGFLFSYTDNAAHVGGIVGGFAIAYVAGTPRLQRPTEKIWWGVAAVALCATAGAFFIMLRHLMASNS